MTSPNQNIEIFYQSLNTDASATVVLIHGAIVSGTDWDLVKPHLNDYHLLIPDSPGHGRSAGLPFSVEGAADHIARLISAQAKEGKAHIVGHSLGSKVAIRLAEKHPDVVHTALVSGYEVYPGLSSAATPYLFWTMNKINDAIPRPAVRWLMDGAEIGRTGKVPFSLYRQISGVASSYWPDPWPARALIIAAGKGEWYMPSYDHPEDAKKLAGIGKERNTETTAVTHPLMRHPWNRQAPKLFAETIRAWVERKDLPDGFAPL